jgi:Arc/MetJ family transcription regulator
MKNLSAFLVVFSLALGSFGLNAENVTVQVSESINERPDAVVRQSARLRATYMGLNKLPVIVKGKEVLSSGRYDEYLSALGAAYVDVTTLEESWDRESGELTLTASVAVDSDKVAVALAQIGDSDYAWAQLKRIQETMDKLLEAKVIDETAVNELDVLQKSIFVSPMIRQTVKETMQAKSRLVNAMANQVRAKQREKLAGLKMEVIDVTTSSLTVSVKGDPQIDASQLFTDAMLSDFYELHTKDILNHAGEPCLQIHRYRWAVNDIPASKTNYENLEFAEAEYYSRDQKRLVDVGQAAVLTMMTYPIAERIVVKDSSRTARLLFDFILQSPEDYLKFGMCVYADKA